MFPEKTQFPTFNSSINYVMKQCIYADNAATTKLSMAAFEAMKPFLLYEYGNPSQPYSFSRATKKALKEARETIASCIGANPEEIYFTSGGTESDNWVISSLGIRNKKAGAILTSAIEHHAVLRPCEAVEEFGLPVAYMWPTESGEITPAILKSYITDSTKLVSVMYVNNEIGTTQPIKQLCDIAHFYGALFHTDAVQAVGHIKINVHELKIDFLSASAHKFNGPRGIGFLYIRKGVTLSPFFHGGSQENGMRAGTENVAAIVGMSIALKENCDRLSSSQEHITMLEKTFFHFLDQSGVKYKRNGTNQMYGIISVSFPNCDGEALLHRLDLKGIYISTGSACDSKRKEVSHVLKAIQLDEIYANGTVRISLSSLNSQEEVITIAQEIIKILRNNSAGSF